MKVRAVSVGILFLTLALSPIRSRAQEPADVPRKALVKTPAVYPTLAQSIEIKFEEQ